MSNAKVTSVNSVTITAWPGTGNMYLKQADSEICVAGHVAVLALSLAIREYGESMKQESEKLGLPWL